MKKDEMKKDEMIVKPVAKSRAIRLGLAMTATFLAIACTDTDTGTQSADKAPTTAVQIVAVEEVIDQAEPLIAELRANLKARPTAAGADDPNARLALPRIAADFERVIAEALRSPMDENERGRLVDALARYRSLAALGFEAGSDGTSASSDAQSQLLEADAMWQVATATATGTERGEVSSTDLTPGVD